MIPWPEIQVGFIGLFALMALVILAVSWLGHGADSAGGGSDGE